MSNENTVSKGMLALRKSNQRGERVTIGGDTFCFKKLTIAMEDELDRIVKENQDETLKEPVRPADESDETAIRKYADEIVEFKQKAAKAFRKLTAEIMKFVLLDETDKPMFSADDPVFENLNNVYAENFFRAYRKFRQGAEGGPAQAEDRFPK